MTDQNTFDLMRALGKKAKAAAASAAHASAATKNKALLTLAMLLRQNAPALAAANQRDLTRAQSSGLAGPLLERLKLSPKDLETVAQGCEQLAAMPDVM
ncbi:MAG: gamma-glutamyl-phosphate reductase, partial [Chitinophagaceae bacterium]|nr:gamma-glutamyl-phosphate reductase [Polaromonas sp.]